MSGDMDLLVRSVSVVSRLLASSRLAKDISASLVADLVWWTNTLVALGVINSNRVMCTSRVKSYFPCSMCKGTGEWHERGVKASRAKWLLCPRCKGSKTESARNPWPAYRVPVGDESLVVVDFQGDPAWVRWTEVPSWLQGGDFDCPTLCEAGRALVDLANFSLATPRDVGRGPLLKTGPYLLDLSPRLEFVCPSEDCKRYGGVIREHVGLLVDTCECWTSGVAILDDMVIPEELHEWLWIERALRHPCQWAYPSAGLPHKVGGCLDALRKHYRLRNIKSWVD